MIERVIWSSGSNWAQWQLLQCPIELRRIADRP
jgi:hypothetical protein